MGETKLDSLDVLLDEIAKRVGTHLKPSRSDGFLTAEEAAAFLGNMPVSTLRWKVREGVIPAYKIGRDMIFDPKELHALVKRFKI